MRKKPVQSLRCSAYLAVRGGLKPTKSAAKSLGCKTEFHMFLLGGEGTLQHHLISLRKNTHRDGSSQQHELSSALKLQISTF